MNKQRGRWNQKESLETDTNNEGTENMIKMKCQDGAMDYIDKRLVIMGRHQRKKQ